MSIIQGIRERAAWLIFGLIAISLIGFLLMDAKRGGFGNSGRPTVVGEVDGQKIEYDDFEREVTNQEDRAKAQGYPVNDPGVEENIRNGVWTQMIEDAVLSRYYTELGLDVSDREVNDMLVGADAIPDVKRAFTDPKTGIFDAQAAAQQINQLRALYKAGPKKGVNADNRQYEAAKSFFEESIPQIIKLRMKQKFTALLANSAYVPKWMIEKMNSDNSEQASISFVNTPYFTIPDSAAKVTDAEITDYVNQHPAEFKQEESRTIAYVTFDDSPSSADSANTKKQLADLKSDFEKTNDPAAFVARIGGNSSFLDQYVSKSWIRVPERDSIFALPKDGVFGPYLDAGSYVMAKLVDEKTLPDSVRARHILVATVDPQTQQPTMDDSTAKKKIDSIKNLIDHGANFDSVAAKLSDDPGTKNKGGDLGYFANNPEDPQHSMVKEFSDFCFNHKVGDKGIVKTRFGYHYIEVTGQKNFQPDYKIAYLSRKIETSTETDQAASGMASQFAGESRDAQSFESNVQKDKLQRLIAPDLTPGEYTIPGLGASRDLVKWAYESDLGNVSQPYPVGDKYVVAVLTEINKPGLMPAAKARIRVEPILRNKKKAEQIIKKLGNPATLDAAATAAGSPVRHVDSLLFSSPDIPLVGREPKVTGASFDKDLTGKPISPAIPGNGGVYFIRVEKVSANSNPNADIQQQRLMQQQQQRDMVMSRLTDYIRRLATVNDYRAKF